MSQADTSPETTQAKSTRSYSLEGLPDREVLVFKSMIRLLNHRTNCTWVYAPLSSGLKVVADGLFPVAHQLIPAQQVLTLGTNNVSRQAYLRLPLHANELEAELNRLGPLIAPPNKVTEASVVEHLKTIPMRMLRWPPAALLTTPARLRLATLMAGKPLTIDELQKRSRENMAVCTAFFDDLMHLKLLQPAVVTPPLALENTQNVAPQVQTTTSRSPVRSGLLERIRMRLGLQIANEPSQASRT